MNEPAIDELISDDGPDQQTPSFRTLDHSSNDKLCLLTNLRLELLARSPTGTIRGGRIFTDEALYPRALVLPPTLHVHFLQGVETSGVQRMRSDQLTGIF